MSSTRKDFPRTNSHHIAGDLRTGVQKLKDATPAGILLGSGKLAFELERLERLDLIDAYKFLVHPRIAVHGPTLDRGGLPSTRHLDLVSGPIAGPRRRSWQFGKAFGSARLGWWKRISCGFFDNLDHEWLMRMLEQRVSDKAFLSLIRKWLKAGILEADGNVLNPVTGTPRGGIISPMLEGSDRVRLRTSPKRLQKSLAAFSTWVKERRNKRLRTLFQELNPKLRGYYNYFGVIGNWRGLRRFMTRWFGRCTSG